MNSRFEKMFVAVLSQHANYAEKQLIRAGELGKCAASIIKRRRRTLWLLYGAFIGTLMIPPVFQTAGRIFSTPGGMSPNMVYGSCLVAFTHLSGIISTQISRSRLETLASIWMLSSDEDSCQTMTDADAELSELMSLEM